MYVPCVSERERERGSKNRKRERDLDLDLDLFIHRPQYTPGMPGGKEKKDPFKLMTGNNS